MIFTRYLLGTGLFVVLFVFSLQLQNAKAQAQVQACGRHLRDLLAVVCHSKYNSPNYRRFLSTYDNYLMDKSEDDYVKSPANFLSDLFTGQTNDIFDSEVPHYRIAKQEFGVVDECCRRSCTLETLKSYCA